MSRIGLQAITVPSGVTIDIAEDNLVTVKGPKGELKQAIAKALIISVEDGKLTISRPDNDRHNRSQHGLARTLIDNMVQGVTKGHEKSLEIIGVGYRAQMEGRNMVLSMGYSHPVRVEAAPGITLEVYQEEKSRSQRIRVSGNDKQAVGQVAADIRKVRKPEPYKGKGIRYVGEVVKLKAGKRAAAKK
jgi:large subunit ribosomal protein L6